MAPVRFKGLFQKTGERSVNNLWSGYGLSPSGKKVAWGVMGVYATYSIANSANEEFNDIVLSQNMDQRGVQSLPSTRADGVGYMAHPGGLANMGASGDLVFALHNLRNGG